MFLTFLVFFFNYSFKTFTLDSKAPKRPQQKKELYTKLDEILFAALRQEFEVSPGCTIDRLDMVKFLTSVVHQHLSDCPDLDKLLNLRDTVLTGRVKKVFPEVEYKRKQIKQDHYRKAYPWQPNCRIQLL